MKNSYEPKISVIIPVYNAEIYVKTAIQSILKQNFFDFEIICIDDGSIDNSLNICKREASYDDRIIVLEQKNQGVSSARNKGIKIAKGKYIIFLDSDDYYAENSLNIMYNDIEEADVDAVIYNHFYDYDGRIIARTPRLKTGIYKFNDISKFILDDGTMTGILFGSACGVIYRAKTLKDNGIYFNEQVSFNEDGIFNIEFLKQATQFIYCGEKHIYAYRQYKSFNDLNIEKLQAKIKITNDYIKDKFNFLKDYELQLKRRELTISFQQSVLICQVQKYTEIKKKFSMLWKDFSFNYFFTCLDFSKINLYKRVLGLLICLRQKKLFICLIKYIYPILKGVIKR